MKQDKYFELRIFICFILTIFYVQYTVLVNKNNEPSTVEVLKEKALDGFEVRIINDHANERLELTETLDQALAYIKEYSMHHDDLVAFNLSTGSIVAKSNSTID
jgi:Na+/phosphate symporter|tara:strand:- start:227 stop:538 length:312 start_codon:yes stop_codon:yes gene_type:complete